MLLAVGLLALVVRLVYLLESFDDPSFAAPIVDAGDYDLVARRLADGGGLDPRLFWQPFLYPVLLAAIYAASSGSILAAKLVQVLLGTATSCLAALLGSRLVDSRVGLAAGIATACYGPLVLFEGELLATGWAAFWGILSVLLLTVAGERFRPGLVVALGAVSAAALLTRPTFIPFLVAAWAWLALRSTRQGGGRRLAALVALGLAGFLPLAAPVALLAQRALGTTTLLPTSGGLNAYIGNNPDPCATLTIRPGEKWGELVDLPLEAGRASLVERDRYFRARVAAFATEHPGAFARGLAAKAWRLVSSRELPRNFDPYLLREWSVLLRALMWKVGSFAFPFGLLLPLAVVGLARLRRRLGAPLLLFLALYSAAIVLVFVAARYRVPLVPVLSVPAAAGLLALVEDVRARRRRALAIWIVLAAAVALVGSVPASFCEERTDLASEFHVTLAFAQSERGETRAAIESYRQALEIGGERADVHYNLGLLARELGESERATAHFERAIELDPAHARALNNLGSMLEGRRRLEEARAAFSQAAELEPDLAPAFRNLGNVLLQLGRGGEAVAPLERALALEPGNANTRFLLGSALLQSGETEAALEQLERAVELESNPRFFNELGSALIAAGRTSDAIARFEAAIALAPDWVDPYTNAGAAAAIGGDLPAAVGYLRRGLEVAPDDADARYNLAVLLRRVGRHEEAEAELRRVLEIAPDHPHARRLMSAAPMAPSPPPTDR
jgi:tetratricopeptide (TPR) repeat protein